MTTTSVSKLLDDIEKIKTDIKMKDLLISELFVTHINQRQEMKQELFVERRLLEQKHEEETVRMESDILRIKTDMDVLEKQLEELVKEESDLTKDQTMKVKYNLKDVNICFNLFFSGVTITTKSQSSMSSVSCLHNVTDASNRDIPGNMSNTTIQCFNQH